MAATERRIPPRINLRTPQSFQRMQAASEIMQKAKAINILARDVYFATNLTMSVGESIEVLIQIPMRVTGMRSRSRRFTSRVAHIESNGVPPGLSKISVLFRYRERSP
jgi:hypothetical protein